MSFQHTNLPITKVLEEIRTRLDECNTLILNAPPGAGKSTVVPLALLDQPWLNGKKIIMLEPRRLAARSIAYRLAEQLGEQVGQQVGYRIRFDTCIGSNTRIEIVTEGILTRMLHTDNALEDVGAIIFDEFHERSLFADVALALSRETQQILRPDLRILIMSATLDMLRLKDLLNAPSVTSSGRQFPVQIIHENDCDLTVLPELTARLVHKAIEEQKGDILVFLPGEAEIRRCENILQNQVQGIVIHPLYGQLPQHKQLAAIFPDREGRRKIILATSIAETSLTIEGITTVIDSGYQRVQKFNPNTGLSRLETVRISLDSADQRAGRAGRLGPGVCYRMWTIATHQRLNKHRSPEIEEADLASLVLEMARWGVSDLYQLTWLTPPPLGHVKQAEKLLHELGALENGKITAHGTEIQQIPCHPRIAHMLLMAKKEGLSSLACDIAALLEERDPLGAEAGIDLNLRIEALRRFRKGTLKNKRLRHIAKIAHQYGSMIEAAEDNGPVDPFQTGLLLVFAFPERIAHAIPGNNAQFRLANGSIAIAGHSDDLAHEQWLAIASLNARNELGRIFLASPLNPRDLAPFVKSNEVIKWDTRQGGFLAQTELRIGNILLQTKPLSNFTEEQKIQAIGEAIRKEGKNLLDFNQEVVQWQNRVNSLRIWDKSIGWPDVRTEILLQNCLEWLGTYLGPIRKPEDLKKLKLKEILHHHLSFEMQMHLDKLAPQKLQVPSGSKIKIEYRENGAPPILAVRLQEIFGMLQTPTICDGKVKLLLHLLSPGFKPVQVTDDLHSFWHSTYFEVRKELKSRYPKHHWPDNPFEASPTKGVKRKK